MIQEQLYQFLSTAAASFFNGLNTLLRGNLPPFGSVCIVIREEDQYLLLKRSDGRIVLPGGFIRWCEAPMEAARREIREETGTQIHILDTIDCFFDPTCSARCMSTLTLVYSAEITSGRPCQAIEGRPAWFSEVEAQTSLEPRYRRYFEGYLHYYRQRALQFQ